MVMVMDVLNAVLTADVLLYLGASLAGWWSFAGVRALPRGAGARPTVAVVMPARDEEHNIGEAVATIVSQLRPGDEWWSTTSRETPPPQLLGKRAPVW
jgi:hypothetical protein